MRNESPAINLTEKVLKYLTVASLAATLLSFLANILLFSYWGINYSTVASASDLVIGAVEAFSILLVPSLVALAAWTIGQFLSPRLQTRPRILTFLGLVLVLLVSTLLLGLGNVAYRAFPKSSLPFNSYIPLFLMFLIVPVGRQRLGFDRVSTTLIILALIFVTMSFFHFGASFRSSELFLLSEPPVEKCKPAYVVWAGTSSIVIACSAPPFDSKRGYVVMPREGAVIGVRMKDTKENAQTH